ncbi:MAG: hypothetical protein NXI32_13065 [bacterium]|nr:hypothetical protein [bacterium]
MKLIISRRGDCQAVYDESLDLQALGPCQIRRASHVEPTQEGQWAADLAPVCGPVLGPYPRRSQALEAERAWLEAWLASRPKPSD